MTQMTSGKVLRETRERKGYDLTTVARRLRIRPDILRAIEAGDYAAMPPRGYTRNMVNAYARLLGLNPTEIVNMYLDEVYAVQVEMARDHAPSSGFYMERESRLGRSHGRSSRQEPVGFDDISGGMLDGASSERRYGRTLYDDRTKYSRDDYGTTRERIERPGKSERDFMSHHSGYSATNIGFLDGGRGGGRTVHVGQTPMEYKPSRVPGFMQSRLAMVVIVGVIVILAIIVAIAVFGNRNAPTESDVSQLPVSGIKDTTGTKEEESSANRVEVAPTSSRVLATVNQGQECYIDTRVDNGEWSEELLTGPTERSFEVTGTFTIATWTPDTISVTVDGVPVELVSDDSIGGLYAYTVDFPKILENWRATHTSREAQRSAAVATAEAGVNAGQNSSDSASAASSESESA